VVNDIDRPPQELLADSGVELRLPHDVVKPRYPIAAHMRWDYPDRRGVVTYQVVGLAPPAPPLPNVCYLTRLLDLMGYGRTGADGSVILHLRDFVCWEEWKFGSEDEVWVVATPRSSDPVYLTHLVQTPPQIGPPPESVDVDMQIRIFTWDPTGQPKPNVFFTWRAVLTVSIPTEDPS
jgi:hypothetical protein